MDWRECDIEWLFEVQYIRLIKRSRLSFWQFFNANYLKRNAALYSAVSYDDRCDPVVGWPIYVV
jgi:hypothetical protein